MDPASCKQLGLHSLDPQLQLLFCCNVHFWSTGHDTAAVVQGMHRRQRTADTMMLSYMNNAVTIIALAAPQQRRPTQAPQTTVHHWTLSVLECRAPVQLMISGLGSNDTCLSWRHQSQDVAVCHLGAGIAVQLLHCIPTQVMVGERHQQPSGSASASGAAAAAAAGGMSQMRGLI